jgi:hypothetical protein
MQGIGHKTLVLGGMLLLNDATLREYLLAKFMYCHGYRTNLSALVTFNEVMPVLPIPSARWLNVCFWHTRGKADITLRTMSVPIALWSAYDGQRVTIFAVAKTRYSFLWLPAV